MEATQKTKLLIWFTALALAMACVPSITAPATPTIDSGVVHTFIAQTAQVALSETAAALPSSTPTPVFTPTAVTETPTPTATATAVLVFYSPTPLVLPTFTAIVSSSDNYACRVIRVSPPNGSSFPAREDFDALWTVTNIGKRKWDRTSVDYVYSSGAKIHKVSGYDLEKNVPPGGTIDLGADMPAPKDPGIYTTTWTMRSGAKAFCTMTLTIVVKAE